MTPETLAALHARAMRVPRPWSAAEFAALLARPEIHLTGDSHGFALGRTVAGEAELLTLATDPNHRRQGHARRRLAAFEAEAQRRGATSLLLEVAADNAAACALYLGSGYRRIGSRRDYYAAGTDALILGKTLVPV